MKIRGPAKPLEKADWALGDLGSRTGGQAAYLLGADVEKKRWTGGVEFQGISLLLEEG